MKKLLTLLILIILGVSCSSKFDRGKLKPYQTTNIYQDSYDRIWADVVEYFAISGFTVDVLNKDSGIITSNYYISKSKHDEHASCAGLPEEAVIKDQFISFDVSVSEGDESLVTIIATTKYVVQYQAFGDEGLKLFEYYCESNGSFEKMFFDFMDRKTGKMDKKTGKDS